MEENAFPLTGRSAQTMENVNAENAHATKALLENVVKLQEPMWKKMIVAEEEKRPVLVC